MDNERLRISPDRTIPDPYLGFPRTVLQDMPINVLEFLRADRSTLGQSEIRNLFGYHQPTEYTAPMHQAVRGIFTDLATILDRMLPEGRAKTEVFTRLDETCMWANKSIAEMAPVHDG